MIDSLTIQRLRALPIEGVAERLGLRVAHHKARCPFHEDTTPSLTFNYRTNTYKCFVCGAYGDTIDLAKHLLPSQLSPSPSLSPSFLDACQWLANEHNVILTEYQTPTRNEHRRSSLYPPDVEYLSHLVSYPVLNEPAHHFLFDERKLNPKVIEWCGISSISADTPCWRYGKPFYDGPSLLIPYKDIQGRVVNVQSRYLGSDAGKPRFRFPSNSSVNIFNLPILLYLKPGEPLYVSEGITDCLALLSSGRKAIAIPSATLLKPKDLDLLKSYLSPPPEREPSPPDGLHIYPDQDEAGERLYHQLREYFPNIIRHQLPEGAKDYAEYWKSIVTNNIKD